MFQERLAILESGFENIMTEVETQMSGIQVEGRRMHCKKSFLKLNWKYEIIPKISFLFTNKRSIEHKIKRPADEDPCCSRRCDVKL